MKHDEKIENIRREQSMWSFKKQNTKITTSVGNYIEQEKAKEKKKERRKKRTHDIKQQILEEKKDM